MHMQKSITLQKLYQKYLQKLFFYQYYKNIFKSNDVDQYEDGIVHYIILLYS